MLPDCLRNTRHEIRRVQQLVEREPRRRQARPEADPHNQAGEEKGNEQRPSKAEFILMMGDNMYGGEKPEDFRAAGRHKVKGARRPLRVRPTDVEVAGAERAPAYPVLTAAIKTGTRLATVYRVLTQFEHAGILKRHHFESGKAVFELNEGQHHDHLLCLTCGRVEEFEDETIEKRQRDRAPDQREDGEELGQSISRNHLSRYRLAPQSESFERALTVPEQRVVEALVVAVDRSCESLQPELLTVAR